MYYLAKHSCSPDEVAATIHILLIESLSPVYEVSKSTSPILQQGKWRSRKVTETTELEKGEWGSNTVSSVQDSWA